MRVPIFSNKILEGNAGDLSNRQVATGFHNDLQQPHQMLGRELNLQQEHQRYTEPIINSKSNRIHQSSYNLPKTKTRRKTQKKQQFKIQAEAIKKKQQGPD